MKLHWVVQKNMIRPDRYFSVINACEKLQYPYSTFRAYPDYPSKLRKTITSNGITSEFPPLPDMPSDGPVIFCATTFVVRRVAEAKKWYPGVYFDIENFTIDAYDKHYQDNFLNHDCKFTTLGEFMKENLPDEDRYFIRPVKDLKEFTGLIIRYKDIAEWKFETDSRDYATPKTEIIVSSPKEISKEWRLVIVNTRVCSGSQYIENGHLKEDPFLPQNIIGFAEDLAKMWSPMPIFVMDICELKNSQIKLLECNCFNCSGFYAADIPKIVKEVSEFT